MSDDDERHQPPRAEAGDSAEAIARAGLGQLIGAALGPLAGVAAGEILNAIVAPRFQRRLHAWMEEVGESLRQLEQRESIDLESLRENDTFVDIAIGATYAAAKTAHQEKREALRNAVLNAAIGGSVDETKAQMFLIFVDSFSPWHLSMLALFSDPSHYIKEHPEIQGISSDVAPSSLIQLVNGVFPQLREDEALAEQIAVDLDARGLTKIGSLKAMMSGHGVVGRRTTRLGEEFLQFTREPSGGSSA